MDLPRDVETYLHRIGRTGRFGTLLPHPLSLLSRIVMDFYYIHYIGTYGVAVTFVSAKENAVLRKMIASANTTIEELPDTIPPEYYAYELSEDGEKETLAVLQAQRQEALSTLSTTATPDEYFQEAEQEQKEKKQGRKAKGDQAEQKGKKNAKEDSKKNLSRNKPGSTAEGMKEKQTGKGKENLNKKEHKQAEDTEAMVTEEYQAGASSAHLQQGGYAYGSTSYPYHHPYHPAPPYYPHPGWYDHAHSYYAHPYPPATQMGWNGWPAYGQGASMAGQGYPYSNWTELGEEEESDDSASSESSSWSDSESSSDSESEESDDGVGYAAYPYQYPYPPQQFPGHQWMNHWAPNFQPYHHTFPSRTPYPHFPFV